MRAIIKRGDEIINTIEIEPDCVAITPEEADAMPMEYLALGKFYVLDAEYSLEFSLGLNDGDGGV